MAKDPAFLLYSSDFLTGTMFMTNEQVGLYIRLLCAQHQHGGRIDTNVLRSQCNGITGGDAVFEKFAHDESGSYNERLAEEIEKRREKSVKAKKSVNKRWEKRESDSYDSNTNVLRSEDENENENENRKDRGVGKGKQKSVSMSTHQRAIDLYHRFYTERNAGTPPKITAKDAKGCKDMIAHFTKMSRAKHPGASDDDIAKMVVAGFEKIFSEWERLEPFLKNQIDLYQIASNINKIINQINNGSGKSNPKNDDLKQFSREIKQQLASGAFRAANAGSDDGEGAQQG